MISEKDLYESGKLHKALLIWSYLDKTGCPFKAVAYADLKLQLNDKHKCPLCSAYQNELDKNCNGCPLSPSGRFAECECLGQPYMEWEICSKQESTDIERRKYYATIIVKKIQRGIFLHYCNRILKEKQNGKI